MHPAERAEWDTLHALGSVRGISVLEVAGAACMLIRELPDNPMVNHTVGVGEDEPAGDEMLDIIADFYGDARYYIALTPRSLPTDIRARLAARGFTRGYAWMKFTRDSAEVPAVETELDVREVGREAGADFADVIVAGYGLPSAVVGTLARVPGAPGCHAYVAYDGDEPAAAGAVFANGDVAWVGLAATRPEHRRKGGQRAILAARLARAQELGVETVVTETGVAREGRPSNSYRNIVRSGFAPAYVRENYLSPARATAAS